MEVLKFRLIFTILNLENMLVLIRKMSDFFDQHFNWFFTNGNKG